MKKCTKCGRELPEERFCKNKTRLDGLAVWCKDCTNIHKKAYFDSHKEERKAYYKAYYDSHKEKIKANYKAYYDSHKEERKATNKAYYDSHKEEMKATHKAYYDSHKEERKDTYNAYCKNLTEYYIKNNIKNRLTKILPEIPIKIDKDNPIIQQLIELKRMEIKLKRFIKTQTL
jgi:hypothetical protein